MKLVVGADHLGAGLKDVIRDHLIARGHEVIDVTPSIAEIDYPEVAIVAARLVSAGEVEGGVLVCGTGIGMAITANKVPGVRAASVSDPYSAERARGSNNAQLLCIGARVVGPELAAILVDHWLDTPFRGGNSGRKVDMINALDRLPLGS